MVIATKVNQVGFDIIHFKYIWLTAPKTVATIPTLKTTKY